MKKVLMLSLAIMMVAGVAMADHIGLYADPAGTTCTGTIAAGVPANVWVVHTTAGASASQFKVQDNTGLLNIGAAIQGGFIAIGTWNAGVSVSYNGCAGGPAVPVYLLTYLAFTPPAACLGLQIVADPAEANGIIKYADCNFLEYPATGGRFFFNADASCPCEEPNANEESTWGKVKSLYR